MWTIIFSERFLDRPIYDKKMDPYHVPLFMIGAVDVLKVKCEEFAN
jgi:hypothetical protein